MMRHKNIVRYVGLEETDEEMGIVMELMAGGFIADFINKHPDTHAVPTEQALEMTMQMAVAMDYIHVQGILHRDIKSENILLAHAHVPGSEKQMCIKLADFGVAVILATNAGSARFSKGGGTEVYFAPERGNGKSYGAMADMFSLGCVVAEICTLTLLAQPIWQHRSQELLERRQSLFQQVPLCVAVRCSALQFGEECCSLFQHVAMCCSL